MPVPLSLCSSGINAQGMAEGLLSSNILKLRFKILKFVFKMLSLVFKIPKLPSPTFHLHVKVTEVAQNICLDERLSICPPSKINDFFYKTQSLKCESVGRPGSPALLQQWCRRFGQSLGLLGWNLPPTSVEVWHVAWVKAGRRRQPQQPLVTSV